MLELRKLLDEVQAMSQDMAARSQENADLARQAREALARFAEVDDALLDKIDRAVSEDPSWRGAEPVGLRLDERHKPEVAASDATVIGVDGSQIYPDRHGMALYYLINTGAIVLRPGSGEAPQTFTQPQVYYRQEEIYVDGRDPVDNRVVNAARELAELREMARLAAQERAAWGGDLDRLILALGDGPLLIWIGEKEMESSQVKGRIADTIAQLQAIQASGGAPVGYVDRPRSANVLRLLHVAQLDLMQISKESVRNTRYRNLTDRSLFESLGPNERSAMFASTALVNREYAQAGQQIHFFYLNVAGEEGEENARPVRVDVPLWVSSQPELLDRVHAAIYRDCEGTAYPYALARAHELAVVTQREREDFEHMLGIAMLKRGELPEWSQKAIMKRLLSGRRR